MKHVVLCADDYNQNPAINNGIIDLVTKQRLSAVSCFTSLPHWEQSAKQLLNYQNHIDIGLHFNLTEQSQFNSLFTVMKQAFLRQLDLKKITTLLNQQLDAFFDVLGKAPDFIDGHQHVHHLPGIRQVLLNVYKQRLRPHNTYIRWANSFSGFPKNLIIKYTGGQQLKRELLQRHIPHNQSFSGVYSFDDSKNYPQYFSQFIREIKDHGLIMCHPGLQSTITENNDSIANSRGYEYQYLASDQFLADCAKEKVVISKFNFC